LVLGIGTNSVFTQISMFLSVTFHAEALCSYLIWLNPKTQNMTKLNVLLTVIFPGDMRHDKTQPLTISLSQVATHDMNEQEVNTRHELWFAGRQTKESRKKCQSINF